MIVIIKHISIEGPGIIGEFFENMPWEVKAFELDKGDRLPEDLNSGILRFRDGRNIKNSLGTD
jgi:hypothetical protein